MLNQEDCDDLERADLLVAAGSACYHACSASSSWVRQYLEWCDYDAAGKDNTASLPALVAKEALGAIVASPPK